MKINKMIVLNFDNYSQKTITSSSTPKWIKYDRIKIKNKYWTPFCIRSVFNDNGNEMEILFGYIPLAILGVIFTIQLYLAFLGNVVSYGGAFVTLVCGYIVRNTMKKFEDCV